MNKPDLVVFDWNGTVLNDLDASVLGMQVVLDRLGDSRKASADLYRQHFQNPIRKIYESLGYGNLTTDEIAEINKSWQAHYKKVEHTLGLQDGIRETIDWLEQEKIPYIVLSNHLHESITIHAKRLDIAFHEILANEGMNDMIDHGKQHRLEKFLEDNSYNRNHIVIIGDSTEEFEIAQKLKIRPLVITNGFYAPSRLKHIPKFCLITTSQLLLALQEMDYEAS